MKRASSVLKRMRTVPVYWWEGTLMQRSREVRLHAQCLSDQSATPAQQLKHKRCTPLH